MINSAFRKLILRLATVSLVVELARVLSPVLDETEAAEVAGSPNSADSCFSCLRNCRHCVRVGVGGKSHGETESLTARGLEFLGFLAKGLNRARSAGAEVVDRGTDELPRDGFIEHASGLELGAVAALLHATVALLLALVRAASEASLTITGHSRTVVQSNGLELAAAHTAVVAEIVAEPASAFAGVHIAGGSSVGVVADQVAGLHLVVIRWWIRSIRNHSGLASGRRRRAFRRRWTARRRSWWSSWSSRGWWWRRRVRVSWRRGRGYSVGVSWRRRRRRDGVIEHGSLQACGFRI
mmetsp:Transcript_1218/g.2321  ORF Transcript_1218/g.2321 Transcript_1218/m.2321 type:complete len:296 (-) Transcript_1218:262-1149(-)